jgi:hypothetical protein
MVGFQGDSSDSELMDNENPLVLKGSIASELTINRNLFEMSSLADI